MLIPEAAAEIPSHWFFVRSRYFTVLLSKSFYSTIHMVLQHYPDHFTILPKSFLQYYPKMFSTRTA